MEPHRSVCCIRCRRLGLSILACARRGVPLGGRTACCVTRQFLACPASSAVRATRWSTAPAVSSLSYSWVVPCAAHSYNSLASYGCSGCRRACGYKHNPAYVNPRAGLSQLLPRQPARLLQLPGLPGRHALAGRQRCLHSVPGRQLLPGWQRLGHALPSGKFISSTFCLEQRGVRALCARHLISGRQHGVHGLPGRQLVQRGRRMRAVPRAPELAGRGPVRALPRGSERAPGGTLHPVQPARERRLCTALGGLDHSERCGEST